MNRPYISIIIPLYNKRSTIKDTIKSVLSQNYDNYELVVVDDGSTDGSVDLLNEIDDCRIKLFQQKNAGPSSARNKGVELAEGEWILFLDADDMLLPAALMKFANLINEFNNVDCISCNFYVLNKSKKNIYSRFYKHSIIHNNFKAWCLCRLIPRAGNTVLKRKILIENKFNVNYMRYEDLEVFVKILHLYKCATDPTPVFIYNLNENAASRPLNNPQNDYIFHIDLLGKRFWEQALLYPLYVQSKRVYGNTNLNNIKVSFGVKFLSFLLKLIEKFRF